LVVEGEKTEETGNDRLWKLAKLGNTGDTSQNSLSLEGVENLRWWRGTTDGYID